MKSRSISPLSRFLAGTAPLLLLAAAHPAPLRAAQWHSLTKTARFEVALDMETLPQVDAPSARVLLRFTPRGEPERRGAGERFGHKNYALHLEQHDIVCSTRTFRLEYQDILGWRGTRLARLAGDGQWLAIPPDSVLDRVYDLACPESGGDEAEESADGVESPSQTPPSLEPPLADETRERINAAQERANAHPGDVTAWVELGNAWYDADMPEQAIQAYDRALALHPGDADVLNDQGAMFRQLGDSARARANFEKALALDPDNLECLYNLGYVYAFDLNDMPRAREIWQRYLKLDDASDTADQIRSFITQHGQNAQKP